MNLSDIVTVLENNEREVVLKVKPFSSLALIRLGGFNGRETSFRITKGAHNTISVKENNMTTLWIAGDNEKSMGERAQKIAHLIKECVIYDFGIHIGTDMNKIVKTSHYQSTADQTKERCEVVIRYFEGINPYVMVYKNDEFVKNCYDLAEAKKYLSDNFVVLSSRSGLTLTNGVVETFKCLTN